MKSVEEAILIAKEHYIKITRETLEIERWTNTLNIDDGQRHMEASHKPTKIVVEYCLAWFNQHMKGMEFSEYVLTSLS
jgi:hypothetical protein